MCKRSPWLHAFSRTASFGRGGLARCRVNAHPAWRDRARRRLPALGRGGADGMPPARALWQVKPAGYLGPALQRAWHCILQLPRARASRPYATQPSGAVCSRFPEHTNASAADCDAHASNGGWAPAALACCHRPPPPHMHRACCCAHLRHSVDRMSTSASSVHNCCFCKARAFNTWPSLARPTLPVPRAGNPLPRLASVG